MIQLIQLTRTDKADYTRVDQPYQLTREEKDELVMGLLEVLKLRVYRAKFEPSLVVLTPE